MNINNLKELVTTFIPAYSITYVTVENNRDILEWYEKIRLITDTLLFADVITTKTYEKIFKSIREFVKLDDITNLKNLF